MFFEILIGLQFTWNMNGSVYVQSALSFSSDESRRDEWITAEDPMELEVFFVTQCRVAKIKDSLFACSFS